jgi:ankyrin repeat protein
MSEHDDLANAIESGDGPSVERILKQHPELVNSPDWVPPPLHCAVLWNQPKIASILLDCGADIELPDPDRQTTPLRYAIVFCKKDLIPLLLSRGANAGPIIENGTSALQLAVDAANGEFEEFDDMPSRTDYVEIVALLKEVRSASD